MKNKRLLTIGIAFGMGIVAGTGGLIAANATDDAKDQASLESLMAGKYQEELPPLKTLGNGLTAGAYRVETPLEGRPDYLEVFLDDGTVAYVKLEDTFAVPVVPLGRKGLIEVSAEEVREMKAADDRLKALANAKGEIWINAYAEDGTTVVGAWLMGHK